MVFDSRYKAQVQLLVQVLPIVAQEKEFALKGGTAINLFVRPMPRLSVDIDLAFTPILPRDETLSACAAALDRIAAVIRKQLGFAALRHATRTDELRVWVKNGSSQIKIEISPVLRGTLHPPELRPVVGVVEQEYGFASIPVVSLPDLYGGKICAALDRQHPRDWFDVLQLLDAGEFNRDIFLGFLVYLLGHSRPLNEILLPRWKSMAQSFTTEFSGMVRESVSLQVLEQTRERLIDSIHQHFTEQDAQFLLSFKRKQPDWSLLPLKDVEALPAVRWKLQNLAKMPAARHAQAVDKLEAVLHRLLSRE
jgi:predicted nucleotidyltransferase component of viral defense system